MEIGLRHVDSNEYFPLNRVKMRIGSHPSCDIVLQHQDIAGQQAEVRVTKLGIEIDSLDNRTKVTVNGYAIDEHFLSKNDEICFGDHIYRLEFNDGRKRPKSLQQTDIDLSGRSSTRRMSRSLLSGPETKVVRDRMKPAAPRTQLPQKGGPGSSSLLGNLGLNNKLKKRQDP